MGKTNACEPKYSYDYIVQDINRPALKAEDLGKPGRQIYLDELNKAVNAGWYPIQWINMGAGRMTIMLEKIDYTGTIHDEGNSLPMVPEKDSKEPR